MKQIPIKGTTKKRHPALQVHAYSTTHGSAIVWKSPRGPPSELARRHENILKATTIPSPDHTHWSISKGHGGPPVVPFGFQRRALESKGSTSLWDVLCKEVGLRCGRHSRKKQQNDKGKSRRESVLKVRSSGLVFPRRGIAPNLLPTFNTGLDTRDTIEGGSDVQAEHGAAVRERRGGVVVDDVSDFFACFRTVDDPVVSVKRWLGAIWVESEVRMCSRVRKGI
jgi:hypothetical protein